nr:hypothetical protein [uncultured Roseateles sp.]
MPGRSGEAHASTQSGGRQDGVSQGSDIREYVDGCAARARHLQQVLTDGLQSQRFPERLDARSCLDGLNAQADKVEDLAEGRLTIAVSRSFECKTSARIEWGDGATSTMHWAVGSTGDKARQSFQAALGRTCVARPIPDASASDRKDAPAPVPLAAVQQRDSDGDAKILEALLSSNPYLTASGDQASEASYYSDRIQGFLKQWPLATDDDRKSWLNMARTMCEYGMKKNKTWNSIAGESARALIEGPKIETAPPEAAQPPFDVVTGEKELLVLIDNNPYPVDHDDHAGYAQRMAQLRVDWDASDDGGKKRVLETANHVNSYATRVMAS